MSFYHPKTLLDKIFEGGLIIKGLTGLLEFLAGLILVVVSPEKIHSFLVFITQKEITSDPHDTFANLILHSTQHLNAGSRIFAIVYLWIHAGIKLIAVIGIIRNNLWAYPFSLITLGALMLYQVYSILVHYSVFMVGLTIFDVFILWLIWREYKIQKPILTKKSNQEVQR